MAVNIKLLMVALEAEPTNHLKNHDQKKTKQAPNLSKKNRP